MSKDLKLDKICDHKIVKEQLYLNSDMRTIQIPRSISSKKVTLQINGYSIEQDNSIYTWSLETDSSYTYSKRHKIVFKRKIKATDNFYFVSYLVIPEECPKCRGLRILNDISYSTLGKVNMVENELKLLQEVKKGITTELGSNAFHTWIGTEINSLIGAKVVNAEALKARIIQEVNKFAEKYLDIQIQQSQYQTVTDREAFLKLLSVQVNLNYELDVSYWDIVIIFRNRTGEDMLFEKKAVIPGPTNLLYGNN